jgi:hypothetical protein
MCDVIRHSVGVQPAETVRAICRCNNLFVNERALVTAIFEEIMENQKLRATFRSLWQKQG